jgi:hypothetical protein
MKVSLRVVGWLAASLARKVSRRCFFLGCTILG